MTISGGRPRAEGESAIADGGGLVPALPARAEQVKDVLAFVGVRGEPLPVEVDPEPGVVGNLDDAVDGNDRPIRDLAGPILVELVE